MEVKALSEFLEAVAAEDDVSDSVRIAAERAAEALDAMREQGPADTEALLVSLRERQRLLERLSRIQRKILGRSSLRDCLLYTSPSPRDLSTSRMPSSA